MLIKIFVFAYLIIFTMSIRAHHNMEDTQHEDEYEDDYHHRLFSKNKGVKGRSFNEVCEHYGGAVCDRVAGVGRKCCSKTGFLGRKTDKVCDTFGCQHDTVSISNMDWDY